MFGGENDVQNLNVLRDDIQNSDAYYYYFIILSHYLKFMVNCIQLFSVSCTTVVFREDREKEERVGCPCMFNIPMRVC